MPCMMASAVTLIISDDIVIYDSHTVPLTLHYTSHNELLLARAIGGGERRT